MKCHLYELTLDLSLSGAGTSCIQGVEKIVWISYNKKNCNKSKFFSVTVFTITQERRTLGCPSLKDVEETFSMRGRLLKLSSDVLPKISTLLSQLWLIMLVPFASRGLRVKMKKQCSLIEYSSVSCVFFLLLLVCDCSAQSFGSSAVSIYILWSMYLLWMH